MVRHEETRGLERASLAASVGAAFLGWTAWLVLIHQCASPFDWPLVRGTARVLSVALPALAYVRWMDRSPPARAFGLGHLPFRAVFTGAFAGLLLAAPAVIPLWNGRAAIQPPVGVAIWWNVILGSPVAEEMLFRGVVFRVLADRTGRGIGALASASLFAAFHVPAWALAGRTGPAMWLGFGQMAFYGLALAWLYWRTKNLACPAIAHVVNNLVTTSIADIDA